MKQILDFSLKIGEQQHWFLFLFMCAKFESCTVNRRKVIEVWNLYLWKLFVTLQWFHNERQRRSQVETLNLINFCSSNCRAFKLVTCGEAVCIFCCVCLSLFVVFWPGGKTLGLHVWPCFPPLFFSSSLGVWGHYFAKTCRPSCKSSNTKYFAVELLFTWEQVFHAPTVQIWAHNSTILPPNNLVIVSQSSITIW